MENLETIQENNNKMGLEKVGKLLCKMAIPAIFSMLIQALYNIIDSLYVSKISETNNELTALNYAFPVQMISLAIALGIGVGTNSVIARCLGAKKQKKADLSAKTGVILAICAYLITLICSFFVPKLFMKIYNPTAVIEELAISYLSIVMAFSIGTYIEVVITKILQGTGNMIVPMLAQLVGAITNIILDPIFIFNAGEGIGLPFGLGLGVKGAAIATVIAQCTSAFFVVLVVVFKKQQVSFNFKEFSLEKKIIKGIFSVGIAVAIMNSINALTTIVLNKILSPDGVTILGTYFKVQSFIFMPVFGLTQGAMPIMGYNYGAKNKKRFMDTFKLSLYISFSIMLIGLLLFQFGSNIITGMFSLGEISNLAIKAFRVISLCFIPAAISIIISSMFQAIGHGYKSTLMSLLRQAVLLIPCAAILKAVTSNDAAVWWSYPISEGICCIIFIIVAINTMRRLFVSLPKTV